MSLINERKKIKKTQQEIADIVGVSVRSYSNWERAGIPIPSDKLAKMSSFGMDIEAIVLGKSMKVVDALPAKKAEVHNIPIYNIHASAGSGSDVENEQRDGAITLSTQYIKQELGCNPKDLSMIFVKGDSMLPTLQPNDPILIDHSIQKVMNDGIYVLRVGDGLHVKRLQAQLNGSIDVISDNTSYKQYTLNKDTSNEVTIVGRVVLNVKKL